MVMIALTSPSGSVNALTNNLSVNFTRRRKFYFAESAARLFKCTRKNFSVIVNTTITTSRSLKCLF